MFAFTSEKKETDEVYTTDDINAENDFTTNCKHLVGTYDEGYGT